LHFRIVNVSVQGSQETYRVRAVCFQRIDQQIHQINLQHQTGGDDYL